MGTFDLQVTVRGGGFLGQAGAVRNAIANALVKFDPEYKLAMRRIDAMTRDSRVVERKKTGQKKARKKFQWVKR